MKSVMFRVALGGLLAVTACTQQVRAAPPSNFDQRVEQLRRASETPGMAIAIVEGGKTVHKGERLLERGAWNENRADPVVHQATAEFHGIPG